MKLELRLKNYITQEPRARERWNKVKCLAHFVSKNHPVLQSIEPKLLTEIIDEIIALERYWRKILADNPDLRGQDYNTKKIVVQRKQVELGYESSALTKSFENAIMDDK